MSIIASRVTRLIELSACSSVRRLSVMKPAVYVTHPGIQQEGIDLLKERCDVTLWHEERPPPRDELLKAVVGKSGIFCNLVDKIDKELFDAAGPNLKVVATMSVGFDHIDVKEARRRGIKLGYTPDVLTDAVAELTVGILLTTARRFFEAHQEIFTGGWKSWSPDWMCGVGIKDKTVGIIGYGRIGHATAVILKGFGIKKIYYTSRSEKADAKAIGAEKKSIEEMLPECDFVICTLAYSAETDKSINARLFGLMKKTAIFVNTGRGGTVDQDALISALETGQIRAAGLDVMTPEPLPADHRLLKLKNCVIIPHIGSATIESRTEMAKLTASNIIAALEGKPLPAEIPS